MFCCSGQKMWVGDACCDYYLLKNKIKIKNKQKRTEYVYLLQNKWKSLHICIYKYVKFTNWKKKNKKSILHFGGKKKANNCCLSTHKLITFNCFHGFLSLYKIINNSHTNIPRKTTYFLNGSLSMVGIRILNYLIIDWLGDFCLFVINCLTMIYLDFILFRVILLLIVFFSIVSVVGVFFVWICIIWKWIIDT